MVTTEVRFTPLSEREIAWYISTGEAEGKAGAYAIQGRAARFIERIDGSWSNVVGLPISTVYRLLAEAGGEGSSRRLRTRLTRRSGKRYSELDFRSQ